MTKVVLVTGASGGIGSSLVDVLSTAGWAVAATDIDEPANAAAASTHELNVADSNAWKLAVDRVLQVHGRLDALVNCAGVPSRGPLKDITDDEWSRVIAVNQTGTFYGIREVVPHMAAAGGGSIVNVSSAMGLIAVGDHLPYVASKFAVTGMTKAAALELGADGIRVNSVHPGPVATTLASGRLPGQPIQRFAEPREIADLVAFVLSDAAIYATGSTFQLDGGLTAGLYR